MNAVLPRLLPSGQILSALQVDETGATAVEYGLIAALVVLGMLGALRALGLDVAGLPLQSLIDAIQNVIA